MAEDGIITVAEFDGEQVPLPATRHPVLYKYFGPPAGDKTYAEVNLERLLVQNQVRLSSNGEVNDPADMSPYIARDHTKKDIQNFSNRLINTPHLDSEIEADRLRMRKSIGNRRSRRKYVREHEAVHEQIAIDSARNNFLSTGFTCLTEEWSNRLMWSHYGQSHKGICIGFRTRPVEDNAILPFAANFMEVKYISDRPVWSTKAMMSGDLQADVITETFFRKDKVWEYEKEWRYTGPINDGSQLSKGGDIIEIGSEEIVEIIFGMRVSEETKRKVMDMVSRSDHSPGLYNTDFMEKSFEMERTIISIKKAA